MKNRLRLANIRLFCLRLFSFVVVALLFSSCSKSSGVNQKNKIELTGNPTTGYTWFYEIEDESVIRLEETEKYLGKGNIVGAPSLFTYKILPLKQGETKVKFEYRRPWENIEEYPPIEMRFYKIFVDEKNKILVEEIDGTV